MPLVLVKFECRSVKFDSLAHQSAEAVAVGGDQHFLATLDRRHDLVFTVQYSAVGGVRGFGRRSVIDR